jgi:hypothetical protein
LLEASGIRDGTIYRSRHNRSMPCATFAILLSPRLTGRGAMHTAADQNHQTQNTPVGKRGNQGTLSAI